MMMTEVGNGRESQKRLVRSDDYDAPWEVPADPNERSSVDARDVGTPDAWLSRHPDLVRLTGRHPFNCEAPLDRLLNHGFLTPTSLHYVRNHGYVPRGDWDTWQVEVRGAVSKPTVLSMNDIVTKFRPRTLPVTLVCAGNRRKEENMVKQTIGFNWGPAGLSTSVWKGARLRDVLKYCGIRSYEDGARYVCFEGEENLPGGGGGGSKYGTSLRFNVAMDESCEVLLAYEMNGERLHPDHGYPVRVLIPGHIGGRMVKWLRVVEVTSTESSNYYHYNDNRVLPSQVDAERAKAEGWWTRPDYIINELNVNSAIGSPSHDEILPINAYTSSMPFSINGYAYSGGGRKVIRAEVSLDGGDSWLLCDLTHKEKPTRYGKYWCWCFWEVKVDVLDLVRATEIACRAWDCSMNTQPERIIWNVMGMMNNCWFRVKVHPVRSKDGCISLRFEHPTRPGNEKGGWMVRKSKEAEGDDDASKEKKASPVNALQKQGAEQKTKIPMSEVGKHDSESSCWIVIQNKVYDATPFLKDHPGGAGSILLNGGTDCTEEFFAIHSDKAVGMLAQFYIGDLDTSDSEEEVVKSTSTQIAQQQQTSLSNGPKACDTGVDLPKVCDVSADVALPVLAPVLVAETKHELTLNPKKCVTLLLTEKESLSTNTRRFRFALPTANHVLGLPIGQHMYLRAKVDGKLVMRAYTPISSDDHIGYVDLVVKIYFKNEHPKFPSGGVFSQYLDSLKLGDPLEVKGPIGHLTFQGKGRFCVDGRATFARRFSMIAGGTGLTPMYQVIQAILKDPEDLTEMALVYANRSEDDILLREKLEEWARDHPLRFKLWFTVDVPPPEDREWKFGLGHINEETVRSHLFPSNEETFALMCGPPPMLKFACVPNLEKLGYGSERIISF